jgi:hypothetical protein
MPAKRKLIIWTVAGMITGCGLDMLVHFAVPDSEYQSISSFWYYQNHGQNWVVPSSAADLIQRAHLLRVAHDFLQDGFWTGAACAFTAGMLAHISNSGKHLRKLGWLPYSVAGILAGVLFVFVDGIIRYCCMNVVQTQDELEIVSRACFSGFCSVVTLGALTVPLAALVGTIYGISRLRGSH